MKKCPVCNSCLKDVWVLPNYYKYCTLCKKAYKITFGGLTEVTEYDTIELIKNIFGERID